ncbi:hypothetical protein H0H93_014597 [Arthromyces matolae]|nr:hypothetical protein H0H93_014597 [Arthromyces matolae]
MALIPSVPTGQSRTDPGFVMPTENWPLRDHPAPQSSSTAPNLSTDPHIHKNGSPLPDNDNSRPLTPDSAHDTYIEWLKNYDLDGGQSGASSRPPSPVPSHEQKPTEPTQEEIQNLRNGDKQHKLFHLFPELKKHARPATSQSGDHGRTPPQTKDARASILQSGRDHGHIDDTIPEKTSPPGDVPPTRDTLVSLLNLYADPPHSQQVPHGKTDIGTSQGQQTSRRKRVPIPGPYSYFPKSPSTPRSASTSTGDDSDLKEPEKKSHRREKLAQMFPDRPSSMVPGVLMGENTGTPRVRN